MAITAGSGELQAEHRLKEMICKVDCDKFSAVLQQDGTVKNDFILEIHSYLCIFNHRL